MRVYTQPDVVLCGTLDAARASRAALLKAVSYMPEGEARDEVAALAIHLRYAIIDAKTRGVIDDGKLANNNEPA